MLIMNNRNYNKENGNGTDLGVEVYDWDLFTEWTDIPPAQPLIQARRVKTMATFQHFDDSFSMQKQSHVCNKCRKNQMSTI